MRSFYGRAALAVMSLGLLGLAGCAEDNEAELNKQAAKGGGSVSTGPAVNNMDDYAKRFKELDTGQKGNAYSSKGAKAADAPKPK
jgi:hypothetical protein